MQNYNNIMTFSHSKSKKNDANENILLIISFLYCTIQKKALSLHSQFRNECNRGVAQSG